MSIDKMVANQLLLLLLFSGGMAVVKLAKGGLVPIKSSEMGPEMVEMPA